MRSKFKRIRIPKARKITGSTPGLTKCPQRKGTCLQVFITSPKKPNSANRKIARVRLTNGQTVTCSIPGEGHRLQKHSVILVRGGRTKDVPGAKYRAVRNQLDFPGLEGRKNARSKYGTKDKAS